jgi:hypothetical protein
VSPRPVPVVDWLDPAGELSAPGQTVPAAERRQLHPGVVTVAVKGVVGKDDRNRGPRMSANHPGCESRSTSRTGWQPNDD